MFFRATLPGSWMKRPSHVGLGLWRGFIVLLVSLSATLQGSAAGLSDAAFAQLEYRAWTCEDSELLTLERDLIAQIQLDPKSARIHYLLSHVLVREFALSPDQIRLARKSMELAQQAVELAPSEEYGYVAQMDLLEIFQQADRAAAILSLVRSRPEIRQSWRTHFAAARLGSGRVEAEVVLQEFAAVIDEEPKSLSILMPFVITVIAANFDDKEQLQQFRSWNRKHHHVFLELAMAGKLVELQRYDEASKLYQGLIRRHPSLLEAKANEAIISYRFLHAYAKAEKLFATVLNSAAPQSVSAQVARVHYGILALRLGKPERGKLLLSEALRQSQNPLETMQFIAQSYSDSGYKRRVAAVLSEVNHILPGRADLYSMLGSLYLNDLMQYKLARDTFTDALVLDPLNADNYVNLGIALYRLNSVSEALLVFDQALVIEPNHAVAFYNRACMLAQLGFEDEAVLSLQRALLLDPGLGAVAMQDEDFGSLRQQLGFKKVLVNARLTGD